MLYVGQMRLKSEEAMGSGEEALAIGQSHDTAIITIMGFRFASLVHAKQLIQRPFSSTKVIPKGYLAVYVGGESRLNRFVIPVAYLNQPSFQDFLSQAEEKFGFDHPMGALTIPCSEDSFIDLISRLSS
ncbi:auxin-responsive protein SAUR24-like [Cannabis sativa]|uniref:auxin-responsive protein SAUR24-like n=1 Tax=Cannabis sativa TaxID=3483 RepID=UPI0029C9F193|nr:auxin-responsive protein SAUR24-like [Cannabis sativa]